MKLLNTALFFLIFSATTVMAQNNTDRPSIYLDIFHGQRFWNDPQDMLKTAGDDLERVKYLTEQMEVTAATANATINYLKSEINAKALNNCDLLFIHMPSTLYSKEEANAIVEYVRNGGSLFLVMDVDYWSTLAQTGVNDIISPFDIQFGGDSADTLSGGYTRAGVLTSKPLKVTYHGARTLSGGTSFCFNTQSQETFGVYKDVNNGGKVVIMGDGMVSLYMTSWKDVTDYQCQEFMQEVFQWLLE